MHRCETYQIMLYLFRYMKTFHYAMKRLQFIQRKEKGTLFSFSTFVEKDKSGFYSKNKL